jgi:NADH-quinone oxidoreductase subunit M
MYSLIVLLAPAVAAVLLFFVPRENVARVHRIAFVATTVSLVAALLMWKGYDPAGDQYQYRIFVPWVKSMGLSFHLGVDGISIAMVLLTAFVIWAGCYISQSIKDRAKEHYILLMALVTGVFGVFLSRDLFFFYFFYEMAVIPMYLLIGVWGSRAAQYSKEYATMKLTLYLTAGAVFALIGLLALYNSSPVKTFNMDVLEAQALSEGFQKLWFPVVFLGFACIVPMWPLHSWSPIGHAAAPSAVSMLHAGVLMKLGAYAILRIGYGIFPIGVEYWIGWVGVICCMNIIYGGFVAMAQRDMKFIIGFSSSSHMGYVLLGLATLNVTGVSGAVFLMFAHGIMTALAFALIGFFYDQTHTRVVDDLGGMIKKLPFIGTCFVIMAMASAGLPGFANFASELLVFLGAWKADFELAGLGVSLPGWIPVMAAIWGIVISATYLLRAVRDAFFGPPNPRWENLRDADTRRRKTPFVALVLVLTLVGCCPSLLVDTIKDGVKRIEVVNATDRRAERTLAPADEGTATEAQR